MHASYRGLSYKSALDVWSLCVRLSLVWTVDVVAACKAFQVASKAECIVRNSAIAVSVVLIPVEQP